MAFLLVMAFMNEQIYIIGGVCTGKSTLAKAFESRGAHYIDLDGYGPSILSRSDVIEDLKMLGVADVVSASGNVNRDAVSEFMLKSKDNMLALNRLLHPKFLESMNNDIACFSDDVPVVIECSAYSGEFARSDDMFLRGASKVIATYVPMSTRRIWASRRDLEESKFEKLLGLQPDQKTYEGVADFVLKNSEWLSSAQRDEKIARLWTACC